MHTFRKLFDHINPLLVGALVLMLSLGMVPIRFGAAHLIEGAPLFQTEDGQDDLWPYLEEGSSSVNALVLQYLLNANGAALTADGAFGPMTTQALMDFQTANGLEATGTTDDATWVFLAVPVEQGDTGDVVRAAQVLLNAAGANLTVDGAFGPLGETAVENFQQSVELPVTGALDTVTWRSLLGNISWQHSW